MHRRSFCFRTALAVALVAAAAGEGLGASEPLQQPSHRVWTDVSGRFRTEATLLRGDDGRAVLQRRDGGHAAVPLGSLSQGDLQYTAEAFLVLDVM